MSVTATIGCIFYVSTQVFKLSQKTLSQPINLAIIIGTGTSENCGSEMMDFSQELRRRNPQIFIWSLFSDCVRYIPCSFTPGHQGQSQRDIYFLIIRGSVSNTVAWQLSPFFENFPSRCFLIKKRKMLLFLWSVMFTLRRDGHKKTEKNGNSVCTFNALCFTMTWDGWLHLI